MSSTELDIGASRALRPKSTTASSLLRRALFGVTLLATFTILLAYLYDAGISPSANAGDSAFVQATSPRN